MRSIPIIAVALALRRVRDLESQRRPGVRGAARVACLRRDRAVGAAGHDRRQPERPRRRRRRDRRRHRRLGRRRRQRRGRRQPSLGAVVGGVAGNAVERDATTQNGVEIIVQLRDGQRRADRPGRRPPMRGHAGDPVIVIVTGGNARDRARAAGRAGCRPTPRRPPTRRRSGYPVPAAYPNAPVQPVYPPSGPVPPRS